MTPARVIKLLFILAGLFVSKVAYCQQDIDFHLSNTFLSGKNVLKVKRDFNDPYLWVLTQNSEVYRINSETLVIENYTPKFAAYNSLQFIDIAGNNKDEVFIATADKLLRYTNGTLSTITSADGLRGHVTDIGFNYRDESFTAEDGSPMPGPILFVGSDISVDYYSITIKRFRSFDADFDWFGVKKDLKVATYRTAALVSKSKDIGQYWDEDMYHINDLTPYTMYGGYIYLGTQYGNHIKTAYYTDEGNRGVIGTSTYMFTLYNSQFWATEKGLFQNRWENSYNPNNGSKHYLDNVPINQIRSIIGLRSFGNRYNEYGRENLLVGTDEGFYFSNSKYYPQEILPTYTFFHYDGLGNKKINYVEVNAVPNNNPLNTRNPYCEDGVWIGANDGLYLLKSDYSDYFDQNQTIKAIQFDGDNADKDDLQLCPGLTTKVTLINESGINVQWYKNAQEIPNESSMSLDINTAGEYYAVLFDPCTGLHLQSNHLKVTYLNGTQIPFNYPDKLNYCYGSAVSLKVPNNPDFQYRWYKDGVLNGINTPEINITGNGKYKLEINSCAGTWVATKEIEVNFIKIPKPVLTTDKTTICAGEEAKITASVPIDATGIINWEAYTYRWYKDGVAITSNTKSITVTESGKYKAEVTACTGNSNISAEQQIKVIDLPVPQITTTKNVFCEGEVAVISSDLTASPDYTINWYKDNTLLTANVNTTSISVSVNGNYRCTISSNLTASSCQQSSDVKQISFVPGPTFAFNYLDVVSKCAGDPIELKIDGNASYKYRWYKNGILNGQINNTLTITEAGKYKAEVSVCENSWVTTKEVEVKYILLPVPIITADKPGYCVGDNASLTVNVPLSPNYIINWYINGNLLTEWQNHTSIFTNTTGTYTAKVLSSLPVCEQVSEDKNITFSVKPTIVIQKIVNTTLCDGQTVDLRVDETGGSIKWSTGETTSKISVTRSGTYKAFYTTTGGCETEAETNILFYPKPVLNLFDKAICAFKNETITLTAPAGFTSYNWNNGESVSSSFIVDKPQTVTLTVTDVNNCQATQQIKIKNQCPDVHMANTFTPNGDGINDTWRITGLEDDPTAKVKIFNRSGNLIFESIGLYKFMGWYF